MRATDRYLPPVQRCAAVLVGLLLAAACLAQTPAGPGRDLVSDILIQGCRRQTVEQVRAQLKTRVNAEYDPSVVQEDLSTLYKTGQFANIYADTVADGPGRRKVVFSVAEYPRLVQRVVYQGAKHLKEDDLNQLTGIRAESPLNPLLNRQACSRIVGKLNEDGRPFATCQLLKGSDPNDTEVIFQITEGPKVKISEVRFVGNDSGFVSGARLKTQIHSSAKILGLGGQYNGAMVDADIVTLIKYYRSFGFHDVQVSRELQYAPDGQDVILVFHIQEGIRYRLQGVPEVIGVKSVPHEQLEALSPIKAADFYNQPAIDGDVKKITNYIGYTGRQARVEAIPVWSKDVPGVVNVQYQVEEQPPSRVGQIFVIGNVRTRQNVIIRQLQVYPGQILTYPDLAQSERNLARLGIFDGGQPGQGPGNGPRLTVLNNPDNPDSPFKDIRVDVTEANTGSLMFGLGVNSSAGLTGSIVLNERNFDITRPPSSLDDFLNGTAFRGAGQEFRLEAVPGTQLQRYTVSFREPFLFDTPYSLLTSGYYWQRFYNEYNEDRIGTRFTLGRKLSPYWQASIGTRVEDVGVHAVSQFAPADYQNVVGNHFLAGFRVDATRDSRDSFMRATAGSLLSLSYEECIGDFVFPLVNASYSKYFTTYQRADGSGRHVLAYRGQFGWAGSNTPVYERFFAGGFQTIRGFQFRGVGPDINGFKVGGDFLLLNSLEYQVPVRANDQIYLVGFVDSGTVESRISQLTDYRVSAGVGIRFTLPMLGPVPIALDLGFPLVQGPRDNQQIFNFWMGFFR